MAGFTIENPALFPENTEVGAYPETNWVVPGPPEGKPLGTATDTRTVEDGVAEFAGLTEGLTYWLVGEVGETYRYTRIYIAIPEEESEDGGGISEKDVEELIDKLELGTASKADIGVEVMSNTDSRVEDLKNKALIVAPVSEDANQTRPKVGGADPGYVLWPNTKTPTKAAEVTGASADFQSNKEGA